MSSGIPELDAFVNKVDRLQAKNPKPAQPRVSGRRPDEMFPEDEVIPGKLISAQGPKPAEKFSMKDLIDQLEELQQAPSISDALGATSKVPKAQGRGVMPRLANQARAELERNPAVRQAAMEDEEAMEGLIDDVAGIIAQGMGVFEEYQAGEDDAYDFSDIAEAVLEYVQDLLDEDDVEEGKTWARDERKARGRGHGRGSRRGRDHRDDRMEDEDLEEGGFPRDDHDGGNVGHKVNQKKGRGSDGRGAPGEFATRRKRKKSKWDNEMDGQGSPGDDET